ncbi:MAG TPA: hypothetical protein VKY73_02985 [Polyangiaceae bacterium]|nr:hypothetical protein [Polyangiaceae bacterium]
MEGASTIHILTHYRHHTAEGKGARESLELSLTHTGRPLLVSTLVLMAGFSTLTFGTFLPNVYFGLLTTVVLGLALLANFFLLPAAILLLEDRTPGPGRRERETSTAPHREEELLPASLPGPT